ncbi:MAG TPA: DUF2924 domain-containing protein [Tepidisphaeraceae bacterium]|jgi:hypothetical protein|nr:DUF2924 domain-containing protein [Tepidisphaeraceae bacterium]
MSTNVKAELAALQHLSPKQLRQKYADVFGEPSRSGNKDFLIKRISWRVQSLAEGGLSERAKARAAEIARDADLRTTVPRTPAVAQTVTLPAPLMNRRLPMPGAVLTRQYQGRLIQVTVLPKGFEWDGTVYRSLSAVAKAVTGSHWNGYGFFNLLQQGDSK